MTYAKTTTTQLRSLRVDSLVIRLLGEDALSVDEKAIVEERADELRSYIRSVVTSFSAREVLTYVQRIRKIPLGEDFFVSLLKLKQAPRTLSTAAASTSRAHNFSVGQRTTSNVTAAQTRPPTTPSLQWKATSQTSSLPAAELYKNLLDGKIPDEEKEFVMARSREICQQFTLAINQHVQEQRFDDILVYIAEVQGQPLLNEVLLSADKNLFIRAFETAANKVRLGLAQSRRPSMDMVSPMVQRSNTNGASSDYKRSTSAPVVPVEIIVIIDDALLTKSNVSQLEANRVCLLIETLCQECKKFLPREMSLLLLSENPKKRVCIKSAQDVLREAKGSSVEALRELFFDGIIGGILVAADARTLEQLSPMFYERGVLSRTVVEPKWEESIEVCRTKTQDRPTGNRAQINKWKVLLKEWLVASNQAMASSEDLLVNIENFLLNKLTKELARNKEDFLPLLQLAKTIYGYFFKLNTTLDKDARDAVWEKVEKAWKIRNCSYGLLDVSEAVNAELDRCDFMVRINEMITAAGGVVQSFMTSPTTRDLMQASDLSRGRLAFIAEDRYGSPPLSEPPEPDTASETEQELARRKEVERIMASYESRVDEKDGAGVSLSEDERRELLAKAKFGEISDEDDDDLDLRDAEILVQKLEKQRKERAEHIQKEAAKVAELKKKVEVTRARVKEQQECEWQALPRIGAEEDKICREALAIKDSEELKPVSQGKSVPLSKFLGSSAILKGMRLCSSTIYDDMSELVTFELNEKLTLICPIVAYNVDSKIEKIPIVKIIKAAFSLQEKVVSGDVDPTPLISKVNIVLKMAIQELAKEGDIVKRDQLVAYIENRDNWIWKILRAILGSEAAITGIVASLTAIWEMPAAALQDIKGADKVIMPKLPGPGSANPAAARSSPATSVTKGGEQSSAASQETSELPLNKGLPITIVKFYFN